MSDWMLDHPFKGLAALLVPVIAGALLGPAAAWALSSARIVTNNVPAGLAMGFGGVLLGLAAGIAAVCWLGRANRA